MSDGDGWLSDDEYSRLTRAERTELAARRKAAQEARDTPEALKKAYRDALDGMPPEGGRHDYVWRVVRVAAKRAEKVLGLTCERFVEDCQAAPNGEGLTEGELRKIWNQPREDAIKAVKPGGEGAPTVPERKPARRCQPWERKPTDEERGAVARLVALGEELGEGARLSDVLKSCTQQPVPDAPAEQAAALMRTLAAIAEAHGIEGGGKWYGGDQYGAKIRTNVRTAADWVKAWTDGGEAVPVLLTKNPMTGEGIEGVDENGTPYRSYRNSGTVAAWLFSLVEFDEMTLERQAAFWLGVLADGALDVVAVVYSGNKSLHGIIRVPATGAGAVGSKANAGAAWGKAERQKDGSYKVRTWGPLSRLVLSSTDIAEHADFGAGDNGCGTFRLAGHLRTDKVPRPTRQGLIWLCAMPEPVTRAAPDPKPETEPRPAPTEPAQLQPTPTAKPQPQPAPAVTRKTDAPAARQWGKPPYPFQGWRSCDRVSCRKCPHAGECHLAWWQPSPVVSLVADEVDALLAFDAPPDTHALACRVQDVYKLDAAEANAWVRRAVDSGAVAVAAVAHETRHALHAAEFTEEWLANPRKVPAPAKPTATRRGWRGTPDPKQWPALGTGCRGLCDACNMRAGCRHAKTPLGRAASREG